MTAADLCRRPNIFRTHRAVPRRNYSAVRRHPRRGEVAAWANAGCRLGLGLGAGYGATIIALTGAAPLVLVGLVAGGLVGGLCGLLVGAVDGAVLTRFVGNPRRYPLAHNRDHQATTVAVIATGITSLSFQVAAFGWLPGRAERVLLVHLPVAISMGAAALLAKRLPPARL
jgi:hypothetical protein